MDRFIAKVLCWLWRKLYWTRFRDSSFRNYLLRVMAFFYGVRTKDEEWWEEI